MNRELKFRAKSIADGTWKIGNLAWRMPNNVVIRDAHGQDWTCEPGTEGQYTGLKDKNGKEIYEGDMVNWRHSDGGDGTLGTGDGQVTYSDGQFYCGFCIPIQYMLHPQGWIEVIGNIHENPELLKP